ncbi:unnamed protein product [Gongylonema pulchrum]|uniref:FLYWCH-type domain-containing protein n=1 Tax=Gongylonema pulchrum TaxID=637853 RepID=A0A183ENK0_9BILA|nr:unnamed protein product [Gongylonema pulchrum]
MYSKNRFQEPPLLALENYCFVIDGDKVDVDRITENSVGWWKPTGSNIRYYCTEQMKTFYQVDALLSRGELRCAYMRKRRGCGMEQVPLHKLFRFVMLLFLGNLVEIHEKGTKKYVCDR